MVIKLLDNKSGVILTRQPELVREEAVFKFIGAPEGATAIFESNGENLYRPLNEGSCVVYVGKLKGEVRISVSVLEGQADACLWSCEGLKVEPVKHSKLIMPNDMNLPERYIELKLENEEIRISQVRLEQRMAELEEKLENIMEGYDLT